MVPTAMPEMKSWAPLLIVALTMPPLRERPEDIVVLANHFILKFSRRVSTRRVRGLSSKARVLLERYPWPGNIRELENVMRRYLAVRSPEALIGRIRSASP